MFHFDLSLRFGRNLRIVRLSTEGVAMDSTHGRRQSSTSTGTLPQQGLSDLLLSHGLRVRRNA